MLLGLLNVASPPVKTSRSEERRVGKECRARWANHRVNKRVTSEALSSVEYPRGDTSVARARQLHPTGSKQRPRAGDLFFFQAEDGIRGTSVTGVQTCALPI